MRINVKGTFSLLTEDQGSVAFFLSYFPFVLPATLMGVFNLSGLVFFFFHKLCCCSSAGL